MPVTAEEIFNVNLLAKSSYLQKKKGGWGRGRADSDGFIGLEK
jgi:hypothetical protein